MNRKPVSVCMATYNGERFLTQQIDSILSQMNDQDELVVVDDASNDNTASIVRSYSDPRIRLETFNINQGHVAAFCRAISLSRNEIIFLSDQDDVWVDRRLDEMVNFFSNNNSIVLSSNSYYINHNGEKIYDVEYDLIKEADSGKYIKNILGIFLGELKYFGCTMAFSRNLIDLILPVPKYVESHDLWVIFVGNMVRGNVHFDGCTLYRRIHGNNASVVSRPFHKKIISRLIFLRMLFDIFYRIVMRIYKKNYSP